MGPREPAVINKGRRPECSRCAWLTITASSRCGLKGKSSRLCASSSGSPCTRPLSISTRRAPTSTRKQEPVTSRAAPCKVMRISAAALGSLGGSLPSCGRKFRWRDTRASSFFSSCRRRQECNHAPAARHEHDAEAQHQIESHELADLCVLRAADLPVLCRHRLFQTANRREKAEPEEQHHQSAHALH